MQTLYHTLNRGVDKRKIFLDKQDYFRFVHDLFEFNDENLVNTTFYRFHQSNDIARRKIERKPRKMLVNVLAFCIMPNHYHLLLAPKVEGGISKFMKKLNMGYAKYFNTKYKRSGALFQGRYKSVLIKDEAHFIHLPYYIHLNPLDLIAPKWRERELTTSNVVNIERFLEKYRWSSYLDYIGKENFPSVTQREFLQEFFGSPEEYKRDILKWLKEMDLGSMSKLTLE